MSRRSFEVEDRNQAELEEYRAWFTMCEHVLVDLGANRGDTILRWLTEETYSGRARSSIIDEIYSLSQRQSFCVLSFEPNGIFESKLLEIEKKLCNNGYKVKVKLRTAVSDRFAESLIYLDDVSTYSYGTSLLSEKKVNFEGKFHALGNEQPVTLVDLTSILKVLPDKVELVVKMDIEGSEYDVLRSLISTGIACKMNILIVEYHAHKLRKGTVPKGVNEAIEWILESKKCGVRIVHDD